VAPSGKRIAAYATAGGLTAAAIAYAVSREFAKRARLPAVAAAPELLLPDDVVHRRIDARDGGVSHLIERGDGPAILLLHGAGLSTEVWSYQLRDLARAHRVIALDLRGHGSSTAGSEGITISAMADDTAEVLDALELEHAVVAGHSMGGMVCLRLARRHPDLLGGRIGGIALISTGAGLGLPAPGWDRQKEAGGDGGGRAFSGTFGFARTGRKAIPGGGVGYMASRIGFGREARPAEVAATLRMLRATQPGVLVALLREVLGFEESEGFEHVEVPVVVAVGTSDHLTPPTLSRRLVETFPHASLDEYVGAGHMLMYERREEIDELLELLSARAAAG